MKNNPLEKQIEREVCKYAESLGWWQSKFSSPNTQGVPDRIFLRKPLVHGKPVDLVLFIEFKRLGGKLSPSQKLCIPEMVRAGALVYIVDRISQGKELFDFYESEIRNSK